MYVLRRSVLLAVACALTSASATLPSGTSTLAYSGAQTYRDESGSCCWFTTGAAAWSVNTEWSGFDYDSKWVGVPPPFSQLPTFNWTPSPSPSGAVECPVDHVPDISEAQAQVSMVYYYYAGGAVWNLPVYQSYSQGYWEDLGKDKYYTGDYIQMQNTYDEYTMAADVLSFHWDSTNGYSNCSF